MSRIVPGAVLGVSFLALREPERAAPENIVLLCEKARCFYLGMLKVADSTLEPVSAYLGSTEQGVGALLRREYWTE